MCIKVPSFSRTAAALCSTGSSHTLTVFHFAFGATFYRLRRGSSSFSLSWLRMALWLGNRFSTRIFLPFCVYHVSLLLLTGAVYSTNVYESNTQLTHSLTSIDFSLCDGATEVTAFEAGSEIAWVSLQRRLSTNTAPTDNMDGGFNVKWSSQPRCHICATDFHTSDFALEGALGRAMALRLERRTFHWIGKLIHLELFRVPFRWQPFFVETVFTQVSFCPWLCSCYHNKCVHFVSQFIWLFNPPLRRHNSLFSSTMNTKFLFHFAWEKIFGAKLAELSRLMRRRSFCLITHRRRRAKRRRESEWVRKSFLCSKYGQCQRDDGKACITENCLWNLGKVA